MADHDLVIILAKEGELGLRCNHDDTSPDWFQRDHVDGVIILDACWLAAWFADIGPALMSMNADWPEHPTFPLPVTVTQVVPDHDDTYIIPASS